jgi:Arc/MetJ-type ribon-helix-helix transcriptional regulator
MCHYGTMHLEPYVAKLRDELAIAAGASGQEARELTERLTASLDSAIRLALLEALSVAAEEITRELAPGSVDLRLRRGEPEFVVAPPVTAALADETDTVAVPDVDAAHPVPQGAKDGAMARINLRLPEHLKARAEQAAEREGLSVNAWLVRTVAEAVEQTDRDQHPRLRTAPRGQRYTGWAR